jgi:hypothetical protein
VSGCNKYLFGNQPSGVALLPEVKGIYADPTDSIIGSTNSLCTSAYSSALIPRNSILGTNSAYNEGNSSNIYGSVLTPNVGICVASSPFKDYLTRNADLSSSGVSVYTGLTRDDYFTGHAHAYGSTVGVVPEKYPISGLRVYNDYLTGSTGSCFINPISELTRANQIGTHAVYLTSNSYFVDPKPNEGIISMPNTSFPYGAVLNTASFYKVDTHIEPTSMHAYVDGTLCLKMFDKSELRMPYGGYSDHILKQTKDLFALNDQLSLLNAESKWLDSKINDDEFYQALYYPYGEDLASYFESWSAQVKLKIQKVEAKVDRLFKYIVKLKIKTGVRRINKKRVFRTKVNLVFKNLDDAHPAKLNYFKLANALFIIFNYKTSWRLTFNN